MKKIFAFIISTILISSCLTNKIITASSALNISDYIYNSIGDAVEYEYGTDVNFYVKNDGTKVLFQVNKSIERTNALLIYKKFEIQGATTPYLEVKGYLYKGVFYERVKAEGTYGKRIVHGNKINIYRVEVGTRPENMGYNYYSQQGENGELQLLSSEDDIRKLVADCSLSVDIVNKGSLGLQKTEGNRNYLNKAIKVYNNNCKPL